jgi:hypothetical protein
LITLRICPSRSSIGSLPLLPDHVFASQRGLLNLLEEVDGEIQRVRLAIVSRVGRVETQHGGAAPDRAGGVRREEAVLFRVDFVATDAAGNFHRRREKIRDGLHGGLRRALREFPQHRAGSDFR